MVTPSLVPTDSSPLAADAPLERLRGLGPHVAAKLGAVGMRTVGDLLRWFPRRHQEVTSVGAPTEAMVGQHVRIAGRVEDVRRSFLPGRRSHVAVTFVADDLTPFVVGFWNQPWLAKSFTKGLRRIVQGRLDKDGARFVVRAPKVLPTNAVDDGPCVVRYAEIDGVSEDRLRRFLAQALERVDAAALVPTLPPALAQIAGASVDPAAALHAMHRPRTVAEHEAARRYFAVHEVHALFTRLDAARARRGARRGPRVVVDAALLARIGQRIPFALTGDQQAAVDAVRSALVGPAPMGMLLQGDVGTGKTAVAMFAALAVIGNGMQVAFLAPTELLAEQHMASLSAWLAGSAVRTTLVTAQLGAEARSAVDAEVASGRAQLVFGTHALLSERTRFARLGLVVIDEQHRFGVEQRMTMVSKGDAPHVLVLSATPIPRTLSLSLFGDLDAVTLREKPPGRRATPAVHVEPREWGRVVRVIGRHVRRGGRVFVVCPKVGEDGERGGTVRVRAVLAGKFRCGVVHGRMPARERIAVTDAFRRGEVDVLVGTTVLEVGVDVAAATLIVVVAAEQFGLATLHQLRGRVGRGGRRGLCVLTGARNDRVDALCATTDGFELAEADLRLRGAGELLGTRQSGVGELRAFDPVGDLELLLRVRRASRGRVGV